MYQDQILLTIGAIAAILCAALVVYLLASHKKSRLFGAILKRETEPFDALSITMRTIGQHTQGSTSTDLTEVTQSEFETVPDTAKSATTGALSTDYLALKPIVGFDAGVLKGQYALRGEVEGGGMSRVFLARKENTGNDWIVKYVSKAIGELTNEANILKELNHTSLPKIIDIFNDNTGLYIVQSYVAGVSMKQVFASAETTVPEFQVLDWAEQLAQVLAYLHSMEQPIFHLDLKPSNIMVTHSNKLVLIDFGISRRQFDTSDTLGITFRYAAPEQFKKDLPPKGQDVVKARFGSLPENSRSWPLDGRTDIYSLGVILFEAAVGDIPTVTNREALRERVSNGLCDIIYKCLQTDQLDRYLSADELLEDIQRQKHHAKPMMHRTLWQRRLAKASAAVALPVAVFCLASGNMLRLTEAGATMLVDPQILTVSVLQSSEVQITRILPDGANALVQMLTDGGERLLDASHIRWDVQSANIAQIDGNRIVGLNTGETIVYGHYRDQHITMRVNVVEPMYGMVDISTRFALGHTVSLFAGSDYRERIDGSLGTAEFVSPESIDVTAGGCIYIADSGVLRRISGGTVETIGIEPAHLRPHILRAYGNDLYILTDVWEDDYGLSSGIIRLSPDGTSSNMEGFHLVDATISTIRDMAVSEGLIYFIERNEWIGATYLRTIDTNNPTSIHTLAELPESTSALALGGGNVFLADAETGALMLYTNGQVQNLAGVSGERHFIDGSAPLFYQPSRIRYQDNALYIWDFNTLRKIMLEGGNAREAVSVAGIASPTYSMAFAENEAAESIVLPYSRLADFVPFDAGILITDPKRGVIWQKK
ncbi:MAG: serine/threonine-protein kinase [Defluviitaleaceae bacterium]|nr:serine/threonine-protein kinase [Defluviitaleaceae bacterium]